MTEPVRISVEEAQRKVTSGQAILVCAYDNEEKFRRMHLEGGMSLQEFKARIPNMPKDQEIIFY